MDEQRRVYEIRIPGCDDVTKFLMELTDAEAAVVQRLAALSKEVSEYSCMPKVHCTLMEDESNGN